MSLEDRVKATNKNVGGKVQEAVGDLTGDPQTQAGRKTNQTEAKVQYSASTNITRSLTFFSILTVGMAAIAFPLKAIAQTEPTSPFIPNEKPVEFLNKVCHTLGTKQSFTVDIDITYDNVLDSGAKVQYSAYQQLSVKRPNQLRADYIGDEKSNQFFYDGKTFSLLAQKANLYSTKPAPASIDEAIATIRDDRSVDIPLSNLVVSDPCKLILPKIQESLYLGLDMVNRIPNFHFLFEGEEIDFQLWISNDVEPVLQKVVISHKNLPNAPQYTAILSKWRFNPNIADDTFKFTPPKGARAIEFLPKADK